MRTRSSVPSSYIESYLVKSISVQNHINKRHMIMEFAKNNNNLDDFLLFSSKTLKAQI